MAILNYEDSPVRMANRLDRMSGAAGIPDTIRLWRDPAPLFVADHGEARPCPQWPALWKAVRDLDPSLVIVDPASAAMAGVSVSEGGPVRAFMRALTGEAERGGFGVLIVAHDTKAARNEAKAGGDPGAGAVAGSATWFDAARGVLYMRRDPDSDGGRKVECIKANYGRTGWTVHLRERLDNCGRFTGFEAVPAASDGGGAGKVPSV